VGKLRNRSCDAPLATVTNWLRNIPLLPLQHEIDAADEAYAPATTIDPSERRSRENGDGTGAEKAARQAARATSETAASQAAQYTYRQ